MGVFMRWLFAFLLLVATYNPTEWNYVDWMLNNPEAPVSVKVLLSLLLSIGYVIYLRATVRSIGGFGMVLVLAVVGAVLWVLHDYGLLKMDDTDENLWLGLFALSVVLGIGLNWSHVRRRLSGQSDMDDVSN